MAFIPTVTTADFDVYWSDDGTTPNGNLSAQAGDVCLTSAGGYFLCQGGTTWENAQTTGQLEVVRVNFPASGGNTVGYPGLAVTGQSLTQAFAYMTTVNTQGAYTLTLTNVSEGLSLLNTATFDMNTLAADTFTALTLNGSATATSFDALDRWSISLESDDVGFDGDGIFIILVFSRT